MGSELTAHLMTIMLMSSSECDLNDIKNEYKKKYCLKSNRKKDKGMKKTDRDKKIDTDNKHGNNAS
jgi:hypothetical protein